MYSTHRERYKHQTFPFEFHSPRFRTYNHGGPMVDTVLHLRVLVSCRVMVRAGIVGHLISNVEDKPAGEDRMKGAFHSRDSEIIV